MKSAKEDCSDVADADVDEGAEAAAAACRRVEVCPAAPVTDAARNTESSIDPPTRHVP